jgi:hypothetical protein
MNNKIIRGKESRINLLKLRKNPLHKENHAEITRQTRDTTHFFTKEKVFAKSIATSTKGVLSTF